MKGARQISFDREIEIALHKESGQDEQHILEQKLFDLQNFIMMGILLCPGTDLEKSKAYYRLVQEAMQDEIESHDSQLNKTFKTALLLSTKILMRVRNLSEDRDKAHGADSDDGDCQKRKVQIDAHRVTVETLEDFDKDAIDDMLDLFKDDVFGDKQKVSMQEFIKIMAGDQKWLLDSELCRRAAEDYLTKN